MAQIDVKVPDIGDFRDVSVIELLVKPGDTVTVEQSLVTVETDKASMEIPCSHAGVLVALKVKLGDKVSQGDVVAVVEVASASVRAEPVEAPAAIAPTPATTPPSVRAEPVEAPVPAPALRQAQGERQLEQGAPPHASPSIRRYARELGVPLDRVRGTGSKGRIVPADVQGFVKQLVAQPPAAPASGPFPGLLPWPQVDFEKFGPIERRDLSRIKKISGANLHRNWVTIPHVTNHDEADVTELEAFRVQLNKENEKSGTKVTLLAFAIKAVVAALKKFPDLNASLDGEQLILKQYFHIGFAADTPSGLVVPVLKNADQKGILQISQEMAELSKKARDGKLGAADMSGGCFSISSLGGIGGSTFTPIINAPEVAILGLGRSRTVPHWNGEAFVPRLSLPLSLSWDHRVIDGAQAGRFNAYLATLFADFRRITL